MPRRKYNIELLLDVLKRDEASLEGDYPILTGKTIITLKCNCGDTTTSKFTDIIVSSGAFCRKCIITHSREMAKKTCKEKYGVENPSQSDKIKEKKTKTTMDHYGVENPFQADEIKEQSKATNVIKYGVENPLQSEEIKEKFKNTLLERYGVEHPSQIDDIKDKKKQTALEKY
ncbi:MAG: hypothetical protein EB127_18575, partial [Alphaproteobacteria bacterium]|nr:hypothetical protein [Alphaproteobacteria bacterium]